MNLSRTAIVVFAFFALSPWAQGAAPTDAFISKQIMSDDFMLLDGQLTLIPGSKAMADKAGTAWQMGSDYLIDYSKAGDFWRLTEILNESKTRKFQARTSTYSGNQLRSQTDCYGQHDLKGSISCATATRHYCQRVRQALNITAGLGGKEDKEMTELRRQLELKSVSGMGSKIEELGKTCSAYSSFLVKALEADQIRTRDKVIDEDFEALNSRTGKLGKTERLRRFSANEAEVKEKGIFYKKARMAKNEADFLALSALIQTCVTKKFADPKTNSEATPTTGKAVR